MPEYNTSMFAFENFSASDPVLAFMGMGPMEMMLVGVAAVLLFGRNLPSVARSAGKSLTEFKKGMQDLQNEVKVSIDTDSNVVASNRSAPVMPDTSDPDTGDRDTADEDIAYDETDEQHDPDYDPDYAERRETDSIEPNTLDDEPEIVDTINDDDDELLNEGYPLPRNASSGNSDDSTL